MRAPVPPRAPTPPPPALSEEEDDDLTSVMARAPFEEMAEAPGRPRVPSLHDDDHARGETMIMSDAPMRGMLGRPIPPPNARREPRPPPDPFGRGARFESAPPPAHPHARARPGSPGTFPPPPDRARRSTGDQPRPSGIPRPPAASVPPLDELVPPAPRLPRQRLSTQPPPSGGTVQIARPPPLTRGGSGRPGFDGSMTAPMGHPIMNPRSAEGGRHPEGPMNPLAPPPQAPPAPLPRPDPSLAVARAAMSPSAPPIVGGRRPSFRPQPDARPAIGGSGAPYAPHGVPARVATNPPPPPAPTVRATPAPQPLTASGIVGLVLFALPLALATFVVAALALL